MILITGATGHVGRPLVQELTARDAEVRVLVRDPARAATLPPGVEGVVGDWLQPATLRAAFAGVERAFLLLPGIAVEPTRYAIAAARPSVRQLVLLSSFAVLGNPTPAMGAWHHEREEMIRSSGIPATILRPTGYMTNTLDWAATIRDGGYVLNPIGAGRHAPIDPRDVAAVAARALTAPPEAWREHTLTGADALTVGEQVELLAAAVGRRIDVRGVASPEDAVRARFPDGAPDALADALIEGFALMREDTVGLRTDTVRNELGRAPRTFAAWCAEHAEAFR